MPSLDRRRFAGMLRAPALASAACLVAGGLVPGGPAHVRAAAAVRSRPRLQGHPLSRDSAYRIVSTSGGCLWSDALGPDQPILTDDQVAAAIGSTVQFSGDTSLPNPYGPPFVGCEASLSRREPRDTGCRPQSTTRIAWGPGRVLEDSHS